MLRTGRTIRSAKMNATTPPKLMPPFHRTAASGTLPIEQTNETTATSGPTSGPQSLAASGWPSRKKPCQKCCGTHAASAPATSRPTAMSTQTDAQSITKYWLVAVNPAGERSRDQMDPPPTAMSMPAWPSMRPATPRSAWSRACSTRLRRSVALNSRARRAIISGPPTNSATVNCQPSSTARMMPSSITRLVEANWKAIAAVKSAPLRKIDLASATAAYEQEEEAAPSPPARQSERGESSGSSRLISLLETTACTAPDRAKPRISAHRISQSIANASPSAWPTGASTLLTPPRPAWPEPSQRRHPVRLPAPCQATLVPRSAAAVHLLRNVADGCRASLLAFGGWSGRASGCSDRAGDLGDEEVAGAGHDGGVADGKPAGPLKPDLCWDELVVLAEPQAHWALDVLGREAPWERHQAFVVDDAAAARAGEVGAEPAGELRPAEQAAVRLAHAAQPERSRCPPGEGVVPAGRASRRSAPGWSRGGIGATSAVPLTRGPSLYAQAAACGPAVGEPDDREALKAQGVGEVAHVVGPVQQPPVWLWGGPPDAGPVGRDQPDAGRGVEEQHRPAVGVAELRVGERAAVREREQVVDARRDLHRWPRHDCLRPTAARAGRTAPAGRSLQRPGRFDRRRCRARPQSHQRSGQMGVPATLSSGAVTAANSATRGTAITRIASSSVPARPVGGGAVSRRIRSGALGPPALSPTTRVGAVASVASAATVSARPWWWAASSSAASSTSRPTATRPALAAGSQGNPVRRTSAASSRRWWRRAWWARSWARTAASWPGSSRCRAAVVSTTGPGRPGRQ